MLVGYEAKLVDRALARGADAAARALGAGAAAFVVGVDRLPPLADLDALLDARLDAAPLVDAAATLDWLFS